MGACNSRSPPGTHSISSSTSAERMRTRRYTRTYAVPVGPVVSGGSTVEFWSPRDSKYKVGMCVEVWSNTQKKWYSDGYIVEVRQYDENNKIAKWIHVRFNMVDDGGSEKWIQPDIADEILRPRPTNVKECQTYDGDVLPESLPSHITELILRATLKAARKVACEGTGEKVAAHGLIFVVGDSKRLMTDVDEDGDPKYGRLQNPTFDFGGKGYNIRAIEGEAKRSFLAACTQDGAIVIDGVDGEICCGSFIVTNLAKASATGGARASAASSIARQAGTCYAIKASEDICGTVDKPPPRDAQLEIFAMSNKVMYLPLHVGN